MGFFFIFKEPSFILSMRFLLAILVFFGYGIQYTQKTGMSVAIVCMVNNTAILLMNNQTSGYISELNYTNQDNYVRSIQCPNKAHSSNGSVN